MRPIILPVSVKKAYKRSRSAAPLILKPGDQWRKTLDTLPRARSPSNDGITVLLIVQLTIPSYQ